PLDWPDFCHLYHHCSCSRGSGGSGDDYCHLSQAQLGGCWRNRCNEVVNNMELYQYSWLILLAPLFSFAVIIFGTRVWDMLSRPHTAVAPASGGHDEHVDAHTTAVEGAHGEAEDPDEDPKVPQLTMGAKASAYVGIAIMALACIYSWVLLVASATSTTLPESGITILSYNW